VTPIARRTPQRWELDIVLRNNRTSAEHPLGIFHPHAEIHPVKKENIGLIEVMGLAVLPGRLAADIPRLAHILDGTPTPADLQMHVPMLEAIAASGDRGTGAVQQAIGEMFVRGLEHCGVFGDSPSCMDGWRRLLEPLGYRQVAP